MAETTWDGWLRIRTIAAIASAIVVVVGGLALAAITVNSHIATNHRVDELERKQKGLLKCIDRYALEVVDLQMQVRKGYAEYLNAKINVLAHRLSTTSEGSQKEKSKSMEDNRERQGKGMGSHERVSG